MFDAKQFLIDHFRTPAEAVGAIAAYSSVPPPKEEAVRKWFSRGSIPADWLVVAFDVIRKRSGVAVDGVEYLRPEPNVLD